jgi:hypothetical protein
VKAAIQAVQKVDPEHLPSAINTLKQLYSQGVATRAQLVQELEQFIRGQGWTR